MKKYMVYKNQIEGFKDVEETVRVVEKSAASQIHLLKKQVAILSEYKRAVEMVLTRLLEFERNENHPLLKMREKGDRVLLIVAGDKGIVGGLYHDLVNQFLKMKGRYQEIWVLGNKAKEYLDGEKIRSEQFFYEAVDLPDPEGIKRLNAEIFTRFQIGTLQSIDILYPTFISLAKQRSVFTRFLPFDIQGKIRGEKTKNGVKHSGNGEGLPIFEPSKRDIFTALLRNYINVFFTQIMFEAKLAEFSARTVTAEHAVSKTKDIVQNLNFTFLKERRKSITQKQLESFIVHKTV